MSVNKSSPFKWIKSYKQILRSCFSVFFQILEILNSQKKFFLAKKILNNFSRGKRENPKRKI
jgi:hypothetical protein